MSTNPTFNKEELTLLLLTILKARNLLFDCTEIKFDKKCLGKPISYTPTWKGKRGTLPMVEELEKILALVRFHVNSEETIQLYETMGMFDQPSKRK